MPTFTRPTILATHVMNKYWHVINVGIQNTLVYRANFFFRAAFGLIPLMATIFLWKAVYAGKSDPSIAGYSLAGMISYYLLVTVVDALTAVNEDDWQIASDIREGQINQFLLKPIDYLTYRLCLFLSGRLVYVVAAIIPIVAILLIQREYLKPPPNAATFALFLGSIFMTALLQFLMSYTIALVAFWILDVSTLIFILFGLEYIAGGHMFPIDIMPPGVVAALQFTPFPYQLFFPVSIYLGRATGPELWTGLLIQFMWIVVMFLLARIVWARGTRKYTAFGG